MNSLDANVILRFLLNDLPAQSEKAKSVITTSQCYVSDVIFTEVVFVLDKLSGLPRMEIAVLLKRLISLQTVLCNEALLDKAIDLYTSKLQLSFPDCFISVEGLLSGDIVLSFDKDLVKHGGSHVREPQ